jgi:hypothetical protein
MSGYIPSRDVDLVAWADNFSALITASPATYGLVAGDATTIATAVAAFDSAYATAVNPSTRTPTTIAAKDSAKGAMVPTLRLYAQTIKLNQGVSNENKVALGIHVNDAGPTPVPPPTSVPTIGLSSIFHLTMQLDIRASETPTSRAKPPGSIAAEVFATVTPLADPTPTDPAAADFLILATRNLTTINFDAAQMGKRVTYWCKWVNRKGETGPWSVPFSQVVA